MNKVISIHLRGVAYQLEENGYETLRAYLDKADKQLSTNPDRSEIMADIEQAIADKFRALLSPSRNVILATEVDVVIKEMGPVTDGSENAGNPPPLPKDGTAPEADEDEAPAPRRLYRLKDGAMLGGVCNGLAAYFGIDVTLIRLAVALLIFVSFGTVALAYLIGLLIIPRARTPEQISAAMGPTPTAREFIRKAKAGYYEGAKAFSNKEERRQWKKKIRDEMKEWKRSFRSEFRWAPPQANTDNPPPAPVTLPLLATLKSILFFFAAVAVIYLLATGTVFGVALPGHLPVWAGIVIIVLLYHLAVSPIKAVRRSYRYCYQNRGPTGVLTDMLQAFLTLLFFVLAIFAADRLIPGFHQVLLDVRDFLQDACRSLHHWWGHNGTEV